LGNGIKEFKKMLLKKIQTKITPDKNKESKE
jgi:hypothetical protein